MIEFNIVEQCQKEEYVYSILCIAESIIWFVTIICIGIFFHILWQTVGYLAFLYILRRRTGGYHLSRFISCYSCSIALFVMIYYLLHKSKTADKSYKRLEPFLQQVHASELNKAIARLFDTYKHENFSGNFRHPFASVMAYQTQANMRDYLPMMLAGIFSDNLLFSVNKSEETNEEN